LGAPASKGLPSGKGKKHKKNTKKGEVDAGKEKNRGELSGKGPYTDLLQKQNERSGKRGGEGGRKLGGGRRTFVNRGGHENGPMG